MPKQTPTSKPALDSRVNMAEIALMFCNNALLQLQSNFIPAPKKKEFAMTDSYEGILLVSIKCNCTPLEKRVCWDDGYDI